MKAMKDWAAEEAIAAQSRAQAEGMEWFDPAGPLHQWNALQKLDALERHYAKGDNFALLHALKVCANHDLVIPRWAAIAFIKGFYAVLGCRTDSWDGAFGRPYRQGMHIAKARQRRLLRPQVYNRINEILGSDPKTPIDEGLFERVGGEFGIRKTLCSRLYYEAKRLGETMFPPNS
jgi:hypothetical protein